MLGGLGDLANLVKQAGQMKENMANWQEELARKTFEGDAGAGMVRAVVNGKCELVNIKIEPRAVEDVEMLEDLVKSAVGAATRKAQEAARADLGKLTGGMNIPGLEQMLGGGQ
ncbi:MAG: YbaB/EbfC family nucleoid-associated protein [Planctomycetes bacterium]|nr:YbaB/EbfC family nucleoid-associated protein [Planctomycetota bacterium]